MKVFAFIPAFNEEESIDKLLKELKQHFKGKKKFILKTLLINDGSTDKTVMIAEKFGVDYITHHPENMGLGAATRSGMRKSLELGADVAIKLDADHQHSVKDIEACVMPIIEDKADIVWGSRFQGKITYKMPLYRKLGNKFFTWLMNLLTDYKISDAQTGLMAFGKNYLKVFKILSDYNPPQQLLIDANSKKMRYYEVPVTFNARKTGKSFISIKYPFKVITAIIWILFHANPLRVFIPISLIFFVTSIIVTIFNLFSFYAGLADIPISNNVLVTVCFLAGLQTLFFGILADMIIKK